ncbi:MAG: Rab family GTPase [Promethearchaeota archaeon]
MSNEIDFTFKILMLGESSTGKTSLSDRYITGYFDPEIKQTVGVDFYVKTLILDDEKGKTRRIKLQIWDLGGESRFRFLLPTYCLGSSGALFLFDLTRSDTLHALNHWVQIVKEKNGKIPIILVGNKKDLAEHRKISKDLGIETAENNELYEFIEVSAKTGENVEILYNKLAKTMLNRLLSQKNIHY